MNSYRLVAALARGSRKARSWGRTMTAKLRIDVSQGLIDIEGDAALVREIYADFKAHLLSGVRFAQSSLSASTGVDIGAATTASTQSAAKPRAKRRPVTKKKSANEEIGVGVFADSPKLDKNLDTSQLVKFYGQFVPKNNSEKILIFLKFLTDILQIEKPNTDHIYTCFKHTSERIPKAFAQAFYDTSTKLGYIDFRSPTDIVITIAGDNHFNHTLKRNVVE